MSIAHKIAADNSFLTLPIRYLFYKFKNKYYDVNNLIDKIKIVENDIIKVTLNDGTVLMNYPASQQADIQFTDRYKFGIKSKLDKIIDVGKYAFVYEIISELFVNRIHFTQFDINPGDIVIDAGANIGGFTIQAAKKVGDNGKVIAIEPDEKNMEVLKMNVEANGLKNVVFVQKGLWSHSGDLELMINTRQGEHSFIINDDFSKYDDIIKINVEVETLDNLMEELNIGKVDFVKMDIEGAEIEALKKADKLLKQDEIKWVVEAAHTVDGEMTYGKLLPVFKEHNYQLVDFEDSYRGTIYAIKE